MRSIKKIISWGALPPQWAWPAALLGGILGGMIFFLVYISNFFSYLSDNPQTCMNCHIMGPEYASWSRSAHRQVTTCVDCHVPHNNVFAQYGFKAMDGLRHATIFTLRREPQAIIMREAGVHAVRQNCVRCHHDLFIHANVQRSGDLLYHRDTDERLCWECHRTTPHGELRSLSSAPYARVPTTESMIPAWLHPFLDEGPGEARQ